MASIPSTAGAVLERSFEVIPGGRCRLRVPRASVTLEGGGPERTAEVTLIPADGTAPEAAQAFADTLRVRYAEGVLYVEPEHPPHLSAPDWRAMREGAPVVQLRVRVPADFGADVHASGGRIDARHLGGSVTLEATGGTIRATGLSGRLAVQARRCQTTVEGFTGKKCSAHVESGRLTVRDARAATFEIESSAAELELDDIEAALHLIAQNGRARITALRGALDADVCGGACTVTPEAGHAVHLRAPGSTVRLHLGALTADLRLTAHRIAFTHADDLEDGRFDGERLPRRVEGALGGGGALVEATAPGGALQCE
jgi:hypothetical protein